MTRCQRWTPAVLVTVLFAVPMTASAETRSATIGVASSITPSAEGGVGTVFQTLTPGSELHASETVRTGDAGKADLVFIDRTNLTVGPTSEVVLDKFVYDPVGSKGKVVVQTTRGAFRFVTGTQDHSAYQINTPYGSLGVRGTAFTCEVKPKGLVKASPQQIAGCDVKCTVESGEVEATTSGGKKRTAHAGQTFCVAGENISVASAAGPPPPSGPPGGGGPGGGGGCVPQITPRVINCP
jgi:ferric-dicitrate binding protein FerR (iron transport regulator)